MKTWQPVEQRARKLFSRARTQTNLLRYQYMPQRNQNYQEITAHLLVVKNSKYSELAQTCINSFLHFHPNSTIVLHVDQDTMPSLMAWISRSRFSKSIELNLVENKEESWQIQKLTLILELAGTKEMFMDADMRWNGPLKIDLQNEKRIRFLVREFNLNSHEVFSKMIAVKNFDCFSSASMFNTSFVCFSGLSLTEMEKDQVLNLQRQIVSFAQDWEIGEVERASVIRISEQLALSMSVTIWSKPVGTVKEFDGCKDGSFLESSYFGATGFKF
jgi:hypothetical protein